MKGVFKGSRVTGARRIALTDVAQALTQLDAELAVVRAITDLPPQKLTTQMYKRAVALRDKLLEEREELLLSFSNRWLKET